jgi:hypothetical protein
LAQTTDISLNTFAAAAGDLDLGSHRLTNVADPTAEQDAATKAYVDEAADPVRPVSAISEQITLTNNEVSAPTPLLLCCAALAFTDRAAGTRHSRWPLERARMSTVTGRPGTCWAAVQAAH